MKWCFNLVVQEQDLRALDIVLEHPFYLGGFSGYFGMSIATRRSNIDMMQYLIDKGADINSGGTILFPSLLSLAAMGGQLSIVQYLLRQGARVTADTIACAEHYKQQEIVDLLKTHL